MPQKTIQDLDAYIKATAVVYDHSNTKLVSRKTKVSRRRKEAFLSVLPYRKPSSHYHSPERRTSSSRKPRSKPAKESNAKDVKQKLHVFVRTPASHRPKTLYFELHPETSVSSLKEVIQKRIGVEARYQRLYIGEIFQLCDLLTLEENGVDKNQIISLELSKDDQNDDAVPKDKATIDEDYLKDLSSKIESSWKDLAKHLGYEEAEIADIQSTNENSTEESRHMLLTWWEKTTDRDEAARRLRRALEAIGLTDLAQNVPVTNESRDEAAGPEPERRQDAGVDEESKQKGAASTEEEKLKKEQVGDQDRPRLICFRYVVLQVFIRSHLRHKSTTMCLQLNPETSVSTLKEIIHEKISVDPQQQRLYIRRNFRNFELCNLLTLQDCGIHQDENISLRLCTDGLLGGGPKDKHHVDDKFFRDLASKTKSSWEKLAKHLAYEEAEIKQIQTTFQDDIERSLQMLLSWWRKQTDREEGLQSLRDALNSIGPAELVLMIPSEEQQRTEQEERGQRDKRPTAFQEGGAKKKQKGTNSSEGQMPSQKEVSHRDKTQPEVRESQATEQNRHKDPVGIAQQDHGKQGNDDIPTSTAPAGDHKTSEQEQQETTKMRAPSEQFTRTEIARDLNNPTSHREGDITAFTENTEQAVKTSHDGKIEREIGKPGITQEQITALPEAQVTGATARESLFDERGAEAQNQSAQQHTVNIDGRNNTTIIGNVTIYQNVKGGRKKKGKRTRRMAFKTQREVESGGAKEKSRQKRTPSIEDQRSRREEVGLPDKSKQELQLGVLKERGRQRGTPSIEDQGPRRDEVDHRDKAKPAKQVGVAEAESSPETLPEDISVLHLSQKIGAHWKSLALFLKFSREDVQRIKANFSNSVANQCFKMLISWWRKQTNYAEARQTLRKALIDSGRSDLLRVTSGSYDLFCLKKSEEIGARWVALAKTLAFTTGEIEIIQHDYRCSVVKQCFEMLSTWWRRQESDTQAKETLERAAVNVSSNISDKMGGAQSSPSDAASQCRSELKTRYTTTGTYLQFLSLGDDDMKHIGDVYKNFGLEKGDHDFVEGEIQEYGNFFLIKGNDGNVIKRIILCGSAGIGKTTIIDKIAWDWAVGSVALGHFTLLFVLQMSALNQTSDLVDSVFDQLLSDDTKVNKCDLEAFIKNNGSSVLILVDGLDEFRTMNLDPEKYGPILRMINQKVCRECFVIVTTRPSQFAKLESNSLLTTSFIHVKLSGFRKKDIEKYARNVFFARLDMAEGLLDRIRASNVLSDLARSPMLLLLMCIFWRENATLPDTLSRLFSEAIRHVFRRKMPELSEEAISEVVIAIGKVALEGLVSPEQRLSFQEGEFEKSALDKAIQAGILTSQRVTKRLDTHNNVEFTHKTLQEYCAAMYCQSLLSKGGGEFQTILAKIGDPWNLEYMLRFCCSDNQQCTRHILGMLHKKAIDPTVKELALNCYFESQSRDLFSVDFIESFFTESMRIDDYSNYSLNSFVWFLKHVADHTEPVGHLAKVRSITFIDCDLSSSSEILALGLTSMKNLRELHSQGINLSDSAKDWAFQLGGIQFLEALRSGTRAASSHSVIPLKKLTLRYSNIDSPDLKYIAKSVSSMGNLVDCDFGRVPKVLRVQPFDNGIRLSISKFSLTGGDMADILRPFSNRKDLVSLILRNIDGLGGSADIWIPLLQNLTHLKELRLTNCPLQSTDIEHLAAAVSQMFPVQSLSFEGSRSSRGSAKALAPSFK